MVAHHLQYHIRLAPTSYIYDILYVHIHHLSDMYVTHCLCEQANRNIPWPSIWRMCISSAIFVLYYAIYIYMCNISMCVRHVRVQNKERPFFRASENYRKRPETLVKTLESPWKSLKILESHEKNFDNPLETAAFFEPFKGSRKLRAACGRNHRSPWRRRCRSPASRCPAGLLASSPSPSPGRRCDLTGPLKQLPFEARGWRHSGPSPCRGGPRGISHTSQHL